MRAWKVWRALLVMGFLSLLVAPAFSGDDEGPAEVNNGWGVCEPTGAWLGVSPGWGLQWTLVYGAGSHWTGPFTLQFIGDASLGGAFPATAYTSTTGTWVRTGRRTFEYTMITYGLAPDPGTGVMTPGLHRQEHGHHRDVRTLRLARVDVAVGRLLRAGPGPLRR